MNYNAEHKYLLNRLTRVEDSFKILERKKVQLESRIEILESGGEDIWNRYGSLDLEECYYLRECFKKKKKSLKKEWENLFYLTQ